MGAWIWNPGGGTAPAKDGQALIDELFPLLNATSSADLKHWTEAELLQWINEGTKRLGRTIALFVERRTTSVTGGTAAYTLATGHVSSVHVSLGNALLRPLNVREVEGLSATWLTDSGTPERYLQDHGTGVEAIRLYKTPTAGGTLAVVEREWPAEITASEDLPLPDVLSDYLLLYTLGEARRKESDGAMPEVSALTDQLLGIYDRVFEEYWGVAA
jgi:hypothetical protein